MTHASCSLLFVLLCLCFGRSTSFLSPSVFAPSNLPRQAACERNPRNLCLVSSQRGFLVSCYGVPASSFSGLKVAHPLMLHMADGNVVSANAPNPSAEEEEEEVWEDDLQDELVEVIDPRSKKTIICFVDQIVDVDGKEYRLGYPVDTPVILARFDDDDDLVQVSEEEETALNGPAAKALSVKNVMLVDSAVVMTVNGELDEDVGSNDDGTDPANFPEDEDYVRVFTTFEHKGEEIHIVEPLDPILVVAKECVPPVKDGDKVWKGALVGLQDVQKLLPAFESYLGSRFDKDYAVMKSVPKSMK